MHKTSGMPFGAWFNDMGDANSTKGEYTYGRRDIFLVQKAAILLSF